MFADVEGNHEPGLNERMSVKSLMEGRRFLYEVVKAPPPGRDGRRQNLRTLCR
jgi:hypothetical protein